MTTMDVIMFVLLGLPISLLLWLVVLLGFKLLWDSFGDK